MLKVCFKCGAEKSSDEFYAHKMMADGHLGKCKECTKSDVRIYSKATRRARSKYERKRYQDPVRKKYVAEQCQIHRDKYPERYKARRTVSDAIRMGELVRGMCEKCGTDERVQAHHDDYSKPLDIRWLCFSHHREVHGQRTV